MNRDFIPAPSILSADFANLENEIQSLMNLGVEWIHVDVMDGHFVPNLTIGAPVVKSLRKMKSAYLDCHLMIEEPERYVDDFIKAGADNITVHIESQGDIPALLKKIKQAGVHAGITLRPQTELVDIKECLPLIDLALVMTVNPGFGGQSFMEDQVEKVTQLKKLREENNYSYKIQVDGGVNAQTKRQLLDADVLVAGSFIFKHPEGYETALNQLKEKS
ncbi:MAG: ribulose-phosphate 3-epimerase [Pseudomonadota bacterium]